MVKVRRFLDIKDGFMHINQYDFNYRVEHRTHSVVFAITALIHAKISTSGCVILVLAQIFFCTLGLAVEIVIIFSLFSA